MPGKRFKEQDMKAYKEDVLRSLRLEFPLLATHDPGRLVYYAAGITNFETQRRASCIGEFIDSEMDLKRVRSVFTRGLTLQESVLDARRAYASSTLQILASGQWQVEDLPEEKRGGFKPDEKKVSFERNFKFIMSSFPLFVAGVGRAAYELSLERTHTGRLASLNEAVRRRVGAYAGVLTELDEGFRSKPWGRLIDISDLQVLKEIVLQPLYIREGRLEQDKMTKLAKRDIGNDE